jgi:glycosyltransferase involved in cell wall biosynthesis
MLNIVRVIPTMAPEWGGPCRLLRDSAMELGKRGINVEVLCADDPSADWLREPFPCHGTGPGAFGYSYTYSLMRWIETHLHRFDAVIVDTLWQWHGLAARLALERCVKRQPERKPPSLFVMPHGGLDPWYQRDPSRRLKALRNSIYWWAVERKLINSADAVIFTAEDEASGSRTTFRGYQPRREVIVKLGVPAPPTRDAEAVDQFRKTWLGANRERGYFLYLNRIHPKKGTDWLMQAYSDARRTAAAGSRLPLLVIAGPGLEGAFGQHVRGLVETRGLQNDVVFTGMLHGDQKWAALYGCHAFVLCSHQENFGIAVVEALACGKPVLITNKVNIWREIENGGGGLVSNQDPADFAGLLNRWSESEPSTGRFTPRKCYEGNFGIEQHAEAFASVIKSVLADRDQGPRQ